MPSFVFFSLATQTYLFHNVDINGIELKGKKKGHGKYMFYNIAEDFNFMPTCSTPLV